MTEDALVCGKAEAVDAKEDVVRREVVRPRLGSDDEDGLVWVLAGGWAWNAERQVVVRECSHVAKKAGRQVTGEQLRRRVYLGLM
jgi:hypothetical protein